MTGLKDYQTRDAKYQLLYAKLWYAMDRVPQDGGLTSDAVEVRLIAWTSDDLEMIVLLSHVIVDREVIVESAKVLHDITVIDAIEAAAKQFEELVAAHPSMSVRLHEKKER